MPGHVYIAGSRGRGFIKNKPSFLGSGRLESCPRRAVALCVEWSAGESKRLMRLLALLWHALLGTLEEVLCELRVRW